MIDSRKALWGKTPRGLFLFGHRDKRQTVPYNPNANWTAKTNAGARAPTYYIAIEGLTTKHYSTAPVRNAGTTKKLLLNVPTALGEKVEQLQGRQSISLMDIELVDRDGEITDLISTEKSSPTLATLVNLRVTLYSGYADLDEADFAEKGRGQIASVRLLNDGVTYRIGLRNLRRHHQDDLFTNAGVTGVVPIKTVLSSDANAGTRTLLVRDAANVEEGEILFLGPSTDAVDVGEEEKVEIAAVNGLTLTTAEDIVKSYGAGDAVRWASTVVEGPVINLLYALQTGDFASGTFPLTTAIGLPTGLGIAAAEIDTAGLIDERDKFLYDDHLRFEILRSIAGFRFIEERIFRLYGFPVLTGGGKLGFRAYRPPFADIAEAGLPTLTPADILSWRWERDHKLHVNRVNIGVDFSAETGKPSNEVLREDTADQAATKETSEIELLDTGYRATLRGLVLAVERGDHLLRRFKVVPDILSLDMPMSRRALLHGEVLEITHPLIPNIRTGARGLTDVRMEIVERREEFDAEKISVRLQFANYVRPAAWAPDSFTFDYDAATDAQKEFAAWAPDAGNFADGGSPYEWV